MRELTQLMSSLTSQNIRRMVPLIKKRKHSKTKEKKFIKERVLYADVDTMLNGDLGKTFHSKIMSISEAEN